MSQGTQVTAYLCKFPTSAVPPDPAPYLFINPVPVFSLTLSIPGSTMTIFRQRLWSQLARTLVLAIVTCCLSAAPAQARPADPAQTVHRNSLSPSERRALFEQVWRLIDEKYYDPAFNGVDWRAVRERYRPRINAARNDDELYALLKAMTGELHDAHTRFHSPSERVRVRRMQGTSIGISIVNLDGKPVVTAVDPDSEASRGGAEPGMIITTVDAIPFADRLAEARREVGISSSERAALLISYHWILAGEPGTKLRLGLQRADGGNLDVTLTRRLVSLTPPLESRTLPSGYAYIRLAIFNGQGASQFRKALERLRDAPGLVVDLRGNPGGQLQLVTRIADGFFPNKVSFGKVITRSGGSPSLLLRLFGVPAQLEAGHSGGQLYAGPVVILVNDGS